ncbi:MAG: hydroxymethylglutaryl-CoA reductase, degradative [Bacteroidetes bacterium]|nr:hydroxymethylglutaryl-CoA reductase, degradative [Bacteroidota bacterium]MDA0936245.1 hydroxymethylglutaryl-CoA reductase, degradative [Bacteroidota bacterium]
MSKKIEGFSKLSKAEKINWITQMHFEDGTKAKEIVTSYNHANDKIQKSHDEFIENAIANYYLPLGVAPNFVINGEEFTLPMAIEESSVVAAASKAAKFWALRGGFKSQVLDTQKIGQIHFLFDGTTEQIDTFFKETKQTLIDSTASLTVNMRKRNGGITGIELRDKSDLIDNYYQLHLSFETADSMGANFINSCLEQIASTLQSLAKDHEAFKIQQLSIEIVMSILSNFVPQCLVKAEVRCPIDRLAIEEGMTGMEFASKFIRAVEIASKEPYRAVTHNKGIMNGIDALIIATGNDFRAVEAGVHAYASKDGSYSSLSKAFFEGNDFVFQLIVPLSLGTVGGLTQLHPLAKWSMELLGHPNAKKLMEIVAVAGLAQNFAAISSLITSGIQKGHMKMHLLNILNQHGATPIQKEKAMNFFKTHNVSYSAVTDFLKSNP